MRDDEMTMARKESCGLMTICRTTESRKLAAVIARATRSWPGGRNDFTVGRGLTFPRARIERFKHPGET